MPQAVTIETANADRFRGREVVGGVRSATFAVVKVGGENRSRFEAVLATQNPVHRENWDCLRGPNGEHITDYDEVLVCTPEAVRTTYLEDGMALCDTHNRFSVLAQFGNVLSKSENGYRFESNELVGTVELNAIADATFVTDAIRQGSINKMSISYRIYRAEWDMTGARPKLMVLDWEPEEVSVCSVPADVKSKIRSNFAAMLSRKTQERTMPPEITPTTPTTPAAPAAPTAPAATVTPPADPAAAARSAPAKVIAADDKDYVTLLANVRSLTGGRDVPEVMAAVEAARSFGADLEQIKHTALKVNSERSLAAPAVTSAVPVGTPAQAPNAPQQRSIVTQETFDAAAIWERRNAARARAH